MHEFYFATHKSLHHYGYHENKEQIKYFATQIKQEMEDPQEKMRKDH